MIATTTNFIFTEHLRIRFCERIHQIKCSKIEKFLSEKFNERKINGIMKKMLLESVECKSIQQNRTVIERLTKKYGDNLIFFKSNKTIFVCNKIDIGYVVMTCYTDKGPIGYYITERNKV